MTSRAIVKTAFSGVEDGKIYPRQIAVGEVIDGDLAKVAIQEKWAEPVGAETKSTVVESESGQVSPQGGQQPAGQASSADVSGGATAPAGGAAPGGAAAPVVVEIPADWKSLKWAELKALSAKLAGREIKDAADAKAVIEAEVALRSK